MCLSYLYIDIFGYMKLYIKNSRGRTLMENEKRGCDCETTSEYIDEPSNDELKENIGCCGETVDETGKPPEEIEECSCGGEFPDKSLVDNPKNPKTAAYNGFFDEFEQFAHSMGIVSIGYVHTDSDWANTEEPLSYLNAIVLTLEMGKDIIVAPPGPKAQELNDATYAKFGQITYALSDFIRAKGFATQVAHPYGDLVSFSPLGQEAGMGWVGQSGLLITPELGPRQKISAIFTSIENLPFKTTEDYSWIIDYCEKCGKCIKACPEKALIETESCCGGKETQFIQNRCIGCSQGCTSCIEACPFDQKGYEHVKTRFDKMNAKLKEKQSKNGNTMKKYNENTKN